MVLRVSQHWATSSSEFLEPRWPKWEMRPHIHPPRLCAALGHFSTLLWGQGQLLGAAGRQQALGACARLTFWLGPALFSVQTLPVQPGDSEPQKGAATEQA